LELPHASSIMATESIKGINPHKLSHQQNMMEDSDKVSYEHAFIKSLDVVPQARQQHQDTQR